MAGVLGSIPIGGNFFNAWFLLVSACKPLILVVMHDEWEVYSVSCFGVLPFIEGSLRDGTSGLVAVSHDSEEHA